MHVKCLSAQNQDVKTLDIDFEYEERAARGVIRKPRSTESQKTSEDSLLKVLSFADDNDNKVDKEGEFTSATLRRQTCLTLSPFVWLSWLTLGPLTSQQ